MLHFFSATFTQFLKPKEPPTNMGRPSCQLGVSTALVAQEKVLFLAIYHMHKHCFQFPAGCFRDLVIIYRLGGGGRGFGAKQGEI